MVILHLMCCGCIMSASAMVSSPSVVALFARGATLSLFTGRSTLLSGLRMLAIGAAAGGVTFMIGRLLGVSVA